MTPSSTARRAPAPELHVAAEFRAPLSYVYSWCTDFDPGDAQREREQYVRRILERTARRVVFEDLEDTKDGWVWSRHVVTLHPPNAWHSESVGSHRDASLEYALTPLPGDRTRLDLRWRRWPTARATVRRSKREIERSTAEAWRHLSRALERDYRADRVRPRR